MLAGDISVVKCQDEDKFVINKQYLDINNDGKIDRAYLGLAKNRDTTNNVLCVFLQKNKGKYQQVLKKELKNFTGRPYNGYSLRTVKNKLVLRLSYPRDRGGSVESYSIFINYKNQVFSLEEILYEKLNLCNFALMERYVINMKKFKNKNLATLDPLSIYETLEKHKFNSQYFRKICISEMKDEYNTMLQKFYTKDFNKLKTYIDSKIVIQTHDLDNKQCLPEEYLDKYLCLNTDKGTTISNNIAFFLEKTHNYKEAIYLLEKILQKYPNRTVAYYNIGDAYWAIGEKEKAKKAYRTYIEQMKAKGKEEKIPRVVMERGR